MRTALRKGHHSTTVDAPPHTHTHMHTHTQWHFSPGMRTRGIYPPHSVRCPVGTVDPGHHAACFYRLRSQVQEGQQRPTEITTSYSSRKGERLAGDAGPRVFLAPETRPVAASTVRRFRALVLLLAWQGAASLSPPRPTFQTLRFPCPV